MQYSHPGYYAKTDEEYRHASLSACNLCKAELALNLRQMQDGLNFSRILKIQVQYFLDMHMCEHNRARIPAEIYENICKLRDQLREMYLPGDADKRTCQYFAGRVQTIYDKFIKDPDSCSSGAATEAEPPWPCGIEACVRKASIAKYTDARAFIPESDNLRIILYNAISEIELRGIYCACGRLRNV